MNISAFVDKYAAADAAQKLTNPAFHIHGDAPPEKSAPVSFALLLNLVSPAMPTISRLCGGLSANMPTGQC